MKKWNAGLLVLLLVSGGMSSYTTAGNHPKKCKKIEALGSSSVVYQQVSKKEAQARPNYIRSDQYTASVEPDKTSRSVPEK